VAAGVATVAIVALQQRAIAPRSQNVVASTVTATNQLPVQGGGGPREALSYTVPAASAEAPVSVAPARLTNYVFAHSKYSSGLGRRGVLADLLIEDDEPQLMPVPRVAQPSIAQPPTTPDERVAP